MDPGLAGGIAGGVIGVMGGLIGTIVGVKNTSKPRERAFAVRMAALMWGCMAAAALWVFLAPRPWNQGAMLFSMPILMLIPAMNRRMAAARAEDERAQA